MSSSKILTHIQNMRLPESKDKRIKLTQEDKAYIRNLHTNENMGIHDISRKYPQVCRRTIQFILYPERIIQSRKNRDWKKYHDRAKLTKSTADIRKRKLDLIKLPILESSKIIITKNTERGYQAAYISKGFRLSVVGGKSHTHALSSILHKLYAVQENLY